MESKREGKLVTPKIICHLIPKFHVTGDVTGDDLNFFGTAEYHLGETHLSSEWPTLNTNFTYLEISCCGQVKMRE